MRRYLLAACLCGPAQALHAQVAAEGDLKAALVYNFAQFTEWGEREPAAGQPFTICYAGAEMAVAFGQIAARSMRGRSVVPRPIAAEGPYEGCQVVYWHAANAQRTFPAMAGPGVLTVGNGVEFLARGGVIETHLENGRFVFSVNLESAQAAGLRFSSKLLRLAKGAAPQ